MRVPISSLINCVYGVIHKFTQSIIIGGFTIKELYNYNCSNPDVYDGDTLIVDIDCGFGISLNRQRLRLLGINAAEITGDTREQGTKARDALREFIAGKTLIITTHQRDDFGRWLSTLYADNANVNEYMLSQGAPLFEPYKERSHHGKNEGKGGAAEKSAGT